MTLYTGIEPEFMLLSRNEDGKLGAFRCDRRSGKALLRLQGPVARQLPCSIRWCHALRSVGIDVYQIDHEDANGQFEVNFTYADALKSADNFTFVKMAASEIARQHGMIASFMPKPFSNRTGSGAHFHISIGDANTKNLFYDASDSNGLALSKMGYHFAARHPASRPRAGGHLCADRELIQAAGRGPRSVRRNLGAGLHRLWRQQSHRVRTYSRWPT